MDIWVKPKWCDWTLNNSDTLRKSHAADVMFTISALKGSTSVLGEKMRHFQLSLSFDVDGNEFCRRLVQRLKLSPTQLVKLQQLATSFSNLDEHQLDELCNFVLVVLMTRDRP